MDPLSVATGTLTILGAGRKIGKGLKKLTRLKDAPDALLALDNEVSDLHCLIQDVENILQQRPEDSGLPQSLTGALRRAKTVLLALESVIAYELTTTTATDGLRVDRSSWLRAKHKVEAIEENIKVAKLSLVTALSLLTS